MRYARVWNKTHAVRGRSQHDRRPTAHTTSYRRSVTRHVFVQLPAGHAWEVRKALRLGEKSLDGAIGEEDRLHLGDVRKRAISGHKGI